MKAAVFCGGEFPKSNIKEQYISKFDIFVIGVDRGCDYLVDNNIYIDMCIGDFDSITKKDTINKISSILKQSNDYSDFEMAVNYVIEKGFSEVYLFGCTGIRSDHFIFNLRLMEKIHKSNIDCYMVDDYNCITIINGSKNFYKENFEFFSIVPIYENTVISISGAKYNLNKRLLDKNSSLTLSNEWEEEKITVETNKLIYIYLIYKN